MDNNLNSIDLRQKHEWTFAFILGLGLAVRLYVGGGVTAADDASMVELAARWLDEGPYLPDSHYSTRVGMTLPLALVFSVFGYGEVQVALLPLACSLISITLAYLFTRHLFDRNTALIAAASIAVFPLDALYGSRFYPDSIFGSISALAIYLIWRAPHKPKTLTWALLGGLIWGYAYLIKVEAFFLGFALLTLFFKREYFVAVVIASVACLSVVLLENLVYWSVAGQFLYRLAAISASGETSLGLVQDYAREGEHLYYLKSWFVIFYNYGLHYYFMFTGIAMALLHRRSDLYPFVAWVVAMIMWLQFGGNFTDSGFHPKTKLLRYNLYFVVPMAVLIGWAFYQCQTLVQKAHQRTTRYLFGFLLIGPGLFFCNFATLSTEREVAIKEALTSLPPGESGLFYMDGATQKIAEMLTLFGEISIHQNTLSNFQSTPDGNRTENSDEYLVVNPAYIKFRSWRYGGAAIKMSVLDRCLNREFTVSNPLPSVSYLQLEFMKTIASSVPPLRDKIAVTADNLLDPNDVVIFKALPDSRACLLSTSEQ